MALVNSGSSSGSDSGGVSGSGRGIGSGSCRGNGSDSGSGRSDGSTCYTFIIKLEFLFLHIVPCFLCVLFYNLM